MAEDPLRAVILDAQQLLAAGQGRPAQLRLEQAVNRLPPDQRPAELLITLSTVYFHLGETLNAEFALRECLSRHSDNANALYNLSFVLDRQGRRDEATQARSAAIRINPLLGKPGGNPPVRRQDPTSTSGRIEEDLAGPMSDFTLPATSEELKEFERRKTDKGRAEFRADWNSNPPLLKLVWVVAVIGILCFFGFLAASFISTVSRTGF